jgi:hypothetical protein
MSLLAQRVSELFDTALARAKEERATEEKLPRRLLGKGDAFDRIAPTQLLIEAVERGLESAKLARDPVVLFLDFGGGGGDGMRCAAAVIGLLGAKRLGGAFVHVSANTPARGLGALVRTSLVDAGAGAGISVDVVAHAKPLGAAALTHGELAEIAERCALTVSLASGGTAALLGADDVPLLEISNVCALSTPDPEALVGDLPALSAAVGEGSGMDGVSFRIEVEAEGGAGSAPLAELGRCAIGPPEDDARERLWQLLDNAKRRRYRAIVTPTHGGLPAGAPLVCPCRGVLERGGHAGVSTARIVPSGNRLVAVGRGRKTLF